MIRAAPSMATAATARRPRPLLVTRPAAGYKGAMRRAAPTGSVLLLLTLLLAGCGLRREVQVEPVPTAAAALLAEGRAALRAASPRDLAAREAARAAAEAARALAPGWIAPRRLLDDLAREELRGPEALAAHLAALEEDPRDAASLYLAGRLEGAQGLERHRRAHAADPDLAWPLHALGWHRLLAGDPRAAAAYAARALERARDPWERAMFAQGLARALLVAERADEAAELLREELERPGLGGADRVELEAWLARAELAGEEPAALERGHQRALRLIAEELVTAEELRALADALQLAGALRLRGDVVLELEAALSARAGPGREALLAELSFDRGARHLALELWRARPDATQTPDAADPRLRAARLAAGEVRAALDEWVAGLPSVVLAGDGLPREPALRRVVAAARAGDGAPELVELGEALLAAGWFLEARGLSSHLALHDVDAALSLSGRAAGGMSLLSDLRDLVGRVDSGRPFAPGLPRGPGEGGEPARARRIDDLDDLLAAVELVLERPRPGVPPLEIGPSPRLSYGPFATIVHPGPVFSAGDESAGRGTEGTPVGGVAGAFAALGRFALFGEALGGGGPDATILRRLAVEQRSGEHLGVPFAGTVVWCAGADVASRPARRGARIVGAALHEGYWVDVDGTREDHARWRLLEARLRAGELPADVLQGRGPRVPPDGARDGARRELGAGLGEGDRVRLAVLHERLLARGDAPDEGGPLVTLDELLHVTALHEEGHLTERTRFLPLSRHLLAALGLLFRAGFSPEGMARRLELRAQLVALCAAPDPRLVLAECLDGLEGGNGVTSHAGAYREIVERLVRQLDRELDRDLARHPSIDPDHRLVPQLHHLAPEALRSLALRLAQDEGLTR